jgi:Ca2+-binding EF-hand superfamily protein
MRRASLAALALALTAVSAPARAQQPPSAVDGKAAFEDSDRNHDGKLDRQEFATRVVDIFFLADTNKDGFLTIEELRAAVVAPESAMKGDKNGDGRLSLQEFENRRFQEFQAADKDQDGELSLDEVLVTYEAGPKKP